MEGNTEDYGMCPDCGEYLEDGICADCGYGEDDDFDMGPEKEPFDFNSPEDKDDMYGNDMSGYMDKDTDF
jgi:transcription initiation factor TFIIIB Brf1 subunit/transcription initiation factor TFIIB